MMDSHKSQSYPKLFQLKLEQLILVKSFRMLNLAPHRKIVDLAEPYYTVDYSQFHLIERWKLSHEHPRRGFNDTEQKQETGSVKIKEGKSRNTKYRVIEKQLKRVVVDITCRALAFQPRLQLRQRREGNSIYPTVETGAKLSWAVLPKNSCSLWVTKYMKYDAIVQRDENVFISLKHCMNREV